MKIGSTLLWAVAASLAAAGLFLLKSQVQAEDERLTELRKEIADTRQEIHVLDAEWSYLNDPARLADEAQTLLGMQPIGPKQIGTIAQIPLTTDPPAPQPVPAPSQQVSQAAPPAHAATPVAALGRPAKGAHR